MPPTWEILPSFRATSPVNEALPVPSTIVPPRGKIAPNGTLHKDIFEAVAAAPISLAKLHRQVAKQNESVPQVMEAVATLVDNALVHPVAPGGLSAEAIAASAGLNRATSAANASGAAVTAWAVPGIGTAVGMDLISMGAAGALSKDPKMSRDDCAQIVLKDLERTGRAVLRDGQPVPDRKAAMDVLKESIRALLNDRMPPLRRLGGFGAGS